MEQSVEGFVKLVNDDLYDLLKWAEELRRDRQRIGTAAREARDLLAAGPERNGHAAYDLLNEALDA